MSSTKCSFLIFLECLLLLSATCLGCNPNQPAPQSYTRIRRHAAPKRCPSCPRDCAEALAGPAWSEPRGRRISRLVPHDPQPIWSLEEQGLYGSQPPVQQQEEPPNRNYWRSDPSLRDTPRLEKLRRNRAPPPPRDEEIEDLQERPERIGKRSKYSRQFRPYKDLPIDDDDDASPSTDVPKKKKKLYVVYRADDEEAKVTRPTPAPEYLTRRELEEIIKQEVARVLQDPQSLESPGPLKRVKRRKILGMRNRPRHGIISRQISETDSASDETQPNYQLDHEIPPRTAAPSNLWNTPGQVPLKLTQMDDMSMIYSMPMMPVESFASAVVEMGPEIPYEIGTDDDEVAESSRHDDAASKKSSGTKESANRRSEASEQVSVAPPIISTSSQQQQQQQPENVTTSSESQNKDQGSR